MCDFIMLQAFLDVTIDDNLIIGYAALYLYQATN